MNQYISQELYKNNQLVNIQRHKMDQGLANGIQLLPQFFNCCFNNRVQLICSNSLCLNSAFVCRNQDCKCIKTYHQKCYLIDASTFLQKLFSRKKPLPADSPCKKAIQQLRQCIQQVFDILSEIRETLDVFQANFGWDQIESRMVELLNANKVQEISGKMISCIYMKVKAKQQVNPFKRQEKYYQSEWNYEYIKKFEIQNQIEFMNKWQTKYKKKMMDFMNEELGWFTKYTNNTQQLIKSHPYQGKNGLQKQLIKTARQRGWSEYSAMFRKGRTMQSIKHIQLAGQINGKPSRIQKCFQSMVNLKTLDLSRNNIRILQNLKFPNLGQLNLSFNQIQKIENMNRLPNLENLRLDSNKLKKIQNLQQLKSLESLQLQNNQICVLENLQQLQKLRIVFINKNAAIISKTAGASLKARTPCLKSLVDKKVKIVMTNGGFCYGQVNYNDPQLID